MWTHLRREASPLLRYRSGDLARVWTSPCACGRTSPRIRIDGRLDDMLRVQAVNVYPQAIGAVLERFGGCAGYAVVADGDPIAPPLRVFVESGGRTVEAECARRCAPTVRASSQRWRPATCRSASRRRAPCTAPPAATRCPTRSDAQEEP